MISVPGHTDDSMCLYNAHTATLFSGDAPLLIHSPGGSYAPEFVTALTALCEREIRTIYPGHGDPLTEHCNSRLRLSLDHVHETATGNFHGIEKENK